MYIRASGLKERIKVDGFFIVSIIFCMFWDVHIIIEMLIPRIVISKNSRIPTPTAY